MQYQLSTAVLALLPLLAAAAPAGELSSLTKRTCQLSSSGSGTRPVTDTKICVPQGKGQWTFGLHTTLTSTGLPSCSGESCDASSDFNTLISDSGLYIFDEACNVKGAYTSDSCSGVPQIIEENFLADVLTITDLSFDVGAPTFTFNYGNGKYSIRNNHCGCQDESKGITAIKSCKCAFPQNGIFTG